MKNFFTGAGEAQGAFSWQHLTFVTFLMIVWIGLAIWLGLRNKSKDAKTKNKVLIWAALLIDGFEIFKIIIGMAYSENPLNSLANNLPFYLCSIQLITIPVAAFTKGRIKEAALDFVFIFGMLGAVAGTYGAAQNYGCYPVLSFPNVVSGITHSISGFAALYIVVVGMASMKLKNAPISYAILGFFGVCAYTANVCLETNYMFLMRHDGTPYSIFYNMVNGNKVIYPIIVILTLVVWITIYYAIFYAIRGNKSNEVQAPVNEESVPVK